jgi:hypothetical protein
MEKLPQHGRINCTTCFKSNNVEFDKTTRSEKGWRITANPLAWGNPEGEIVILGFSKGPTQAGALATSVHDEIAYKGSRKNVGKILSYIGLLPISTQETLSQDVSTAIVDRSGRFHFGSLVRCTVERYSEKDMAWKGSGGGMLDKFVATDFGQEVASNCTKNFLRHFHVNTKLIVMFGLGTKLNYVHASFKLFQNARGGNWSWLNEVAYTDGKVFVIHVEHFASQGPLIPKWMGQGNDPRGRYGRMAQEIVQLALSSSEAH